MHVCMLISVRLGHIFDFFFLNQRMMSLACWGKLGYLSWPIDTGIVFSILSSMLEGASITVYVY